MYWFSKLVLFHFRLSRKHTILYLDYMRHVELIYNFCRHLENEHDNYVGSDWCFDWKVINEWHVKWTNQWKLMDENSLKTARLSIVKIKLENSRVKELNNNQNLLSLHALLFLNKNNCVANFGILKIHFTTHCVVRYTDRKITYYTYNLCKIF